MPIWVSTNLEFVFVFFALTFWHIDLIQLFITGARNQEYPSVSDMLMLPL